MKSSASKQMMSAPLGVRLSQFIIKGVVTQTSMQAIIILPVKTSGSRHIKSAPSAAAVGHIFRPSRFASIVFIIY
jgi:hypothetical protein